MILIEEAEIPASLVRTTVTTYATQQISALNERIMTVTRLTEIIEKFDLFVEERRNTPIELLTDNVRRNVGVEFVNAEAITPEGRPQTFVVAFTVSYEDKNPAGASTI